MSHGYMGLGLAAVQKAHSIHESVPGLIKDGFTYSIIKKI